MKKNKNATNLVNNYDTTDCTKTHNSTSDCQNVTPDYGNVAQNCDNCKSQKQSQSCNSKK